MTDAVRTQLAELSAIVLLTILFLLLAATSVALFLAGRGLSRLTAGMRARGPQVASSAHRLETASREVARGFLEPQIRITSRLVGLKAGLHALLRGSRR